MKCTLAVLLTLVMTAAACGGDDPPESSRNDGISALEQEDGGAGPDSSPGEDKDGAEGATKKRKDAGTGGAAGNKSSRTKGSSRGTSEVSDDDAKMRGGRNAAQAAAAVPIPTGTHAYSTDGHTTISGNSNPMPTTTTLTAHAPQGGEQRQIRDLRDDDGNGMVTELRALYRPDGVFLTYVKVTSTFAGGFTDVREFTVPKPELIAPTGGRPSFTRTFTMRGSGTRADVTVRALRFERVAIGGSPERALVVESKIAFSGSLEGEQTSKSWFWPKHILVLKEQVRTDVTNGPVRYRNNYEAVLKQLP